MSTIEQLKRSLEDMGISHAIVIDDKLNEDQQVITDILSGSYDSSEFDVRLFVEKLGYTIEQLKETETLPPLVVKKLKEQFPSIIKSEISELLAILSQIFAKERIQYWDSVTQKPTIESNTILFLDYTLEGSLIKSEQLAHLLAESSTSDSNPRCIVFISSNKTFTVEGERYRMLDYKQRTQYFRKLREQHESRKYKNTVYDYIYKGYLTTEDNTQSELFKVFQNLYGSKKFFELLNCVEEILYNSSGAVLGQFHLLNARSIQVMIKEKVVEEGISASTFLVQWIARHIAKKVEQREETGLKIDRILREINEWTQSYYETHEDVVLREILLSEMWDKTVNERYLPVDFGDIFEINYNSEKRRAILLTQTCTLAIRNNGKRTGRVAMLALENKEKLGRESGITLDDWTNEKITFDLDETISIPISFLDLTTLNNDGAAVLQWVSGGDPFTCPSSALWSDGYKQMMNKFVDSLAQTLMRSNTAMYQIDETYMPFKNENTPQLYRYEFPIKRLSRLDQQYSLYVLQEAQAWWGRIGLPVNVNFMDDYKENDGTISAHGAIFPCKVYVKKRLNDIVDIGISLEELSRIVGKIYHDDVDCSEHFQFLFNKPELAHLHFASGQKILSLKANKTGLELLEKNKVYITLTDGNQCSIDLKIGKVSKFLMDGDDITSSVVDFNTDSAGNIRFKLIKTLLEERDLAQYVEKIDYKTSIVDGIGPVVSLSRKDQIFECIIEKNFMKLQVRFDRIQQQESAAAKDQ